MGWFKKIKPISDKVLNRLAEDLRPTKEWKVSVTQSDVEMFGQRHGRRAVAEVLGKMGRFQPYYNILTSELGQYVVGDAISQCNTLLRKIAENRASDDEKAEYRAYMRIIRRQVELIYSYINTAQKARGS